MRYRELLSAVLSEGVTDNLPVAAWQHHPIADQDIDAFVDSTLAFQARHDFDFVKLTPASTWQSRDRGLVDAWEGDFVGRRKVVGQVIATAQDWSRLPPINPRAGFSARILAAAALTRRRLPRHVPVIATVFNPVFQASQLRGFANLLSDAELYPELMRQALNRLRDDTIAAIHAFRDAGIDGIFYVTQHAHAGAVTAPRWQDIGLVDDLACLAACAGLPFNLLHLHGAAVHARLYAGGEAILHYDHDQDNPEPAALSRRFPAGIATGPCAHTTLVQATPAEIAGAVLKLRQSMTGRRFILAPGCAVPLTATTARIDALSEAARRPRRLAA